MLERIIKQVMKQLVRRGILVEDQGEMYLADDEEDSEQARVPRPRLHLIRFHGFLAPNAKLRAKVVPRPAGEPAQKESTPEDGEAIIGRTNHGRPMRLGWA